MRWAAKDVFNPGAVVRDGRLHLLVRAEDEVGLFAGTSRIGLAVADGSGRTFTLSPEPVLFPDNDEWSALEWPGGCEDPRVVESPDGRYVCCYSAFDGTRSRLMVATSDDLVTWRKHGPAFAGTPAADRWSKSGAIVTSVVDGRLQATRVGGRYVMYWGEGTCFLASSDDLVHWTPLECSPDDDRYLTFGEDGTLGSVRVHRVPGRPVLRPVLAPRPDRFDALLVEPGPPAILGAEGIVLVYNGARRVVGNGVPKGVTYQPGYAVFDEHEPGSPLERCREASPPAGLRRLIGQVDGVCFAQGLALHEGQWHLFIGMADSRIGHAVAPAPTS
ncbi:MAG TPA: glycoside hydrolase family 130 protein [Acidimicrobiales bacterium]|nr:glycoside hydrolase family 130 protein [Acidimicrobiales bacterium]